MLALMALWVWIFASFFWISKLGNSKHIHALVMGTQMYGIGFDFSWIGMVIQSAFYLMDWFLKSFKFAQDSFFFGFVPDQQQKKGVDMDMRILFLPRSDTLGSMVLVWPRRFVASSRWGRRVKLGEAPHFGGPPKLRFSRENIWAPYIEVFDGIFFLNLWQSTFGVLWSKLDSSTSPSLDDARFPAILVDVDITYLYIYI